MEASLKINFKPFPEIETERLLLRQLNKYDAGDIYLLRSDPLVNKFIKRPETANEEDALKFIKKILPTGKHSLGSLENYTNFLSKGAVFNITGIELGSFFKGEFVTSGYLP